MSNRYVEDALALPSLEIVSSTHRFNLRKYKQHLRVGGVEIDLYAYFTTRSGVERTVLIELKDSDFTKLHKQLVDRVLMANYVYGSINLPAYVILQDSYWRKLLMDLYHMGIGLITWQLQHPQVLLKAKFRSNLTAYSIKDEDKEGIWPGSNSGDNYEEGL